MAEYYPAFLDLRGREGTVVGGGEVAERKVQALLACGASVTVISPKLSDILEELADQGAISVVRRGYRPGDLRRATIAIAATDDATVNARVAAEARKRRVLVNVVDTPELCDFIAPSVVRRGDILIAISTSGQSPALAKKLRMELEKAIPPEYAELSSLLAEVRATVRERGTQIPAERWQESMDTHLMELIRQGEMAEARKRLLNMLEGKKGSNSQEKGVGR